MLSVKKAFVQMSSEQFLYLLILLFLFNMDMQGPCVAAGRSAWVLRPHESSNRLQNFFEKIYPQAERMKKALASFYNTLSKTAKSLAEDGVTPAIDDESNSETTKLFYVKPENTAEFLIEADGYNPQSHTVLTEDGYLLTIQRILTDLNELYTKKPIIILHHGLFGSAEDWLLLGKFRALPYMLADCGFDVWLLNARGNKYSKAHSSVSSLKTEFWDFSFHEIGVYDLPAVVKYITAVTGVGEINYIGHSLGSTAFLILLSTFPEYNYIFKSGILIAPLVFMKYASGPIATLADFYEKNGRNSLNYLGDSEFFQKGNFPNQIVSKYCKGSERGCANPLLLLTNGGIELAANSLMENILRYTPGGGSVKTLIHYVQLVNSGNFQQFDYGSDNNSIIYKNITPPLYNLTRVKIPIALFSSPSDWLANETDVKTLIGNLNNVSTHHSIMTSDFGHYDFLWSLLAPDLVYDSVISILEKILPKET